MVRSAALRSEFPEVGPVSAPPRNAPIVPYTWLLHLSGPEGAKAPEPEYPNLPGPDTPLGPCRQLIYPYGSAVRLETRGSASVNVLSGAH